MISQFALRLICGMSLMWSLMPRRQVTSGFFRIQMLVVMGLGVLAALDIGMQGQTVWKSVDPNVATVVMSSPLRASLPAALIAFAGFLGSVFWTLEQRRAGTWIGIVILVVSAACLATNLISGSVMFIIPSGVLVTESRFVTWFDFLVLLSQIAAAAVLGGMIVGMLLGHWYLTATTMSIEPLQRINQFLGIAGLLRLFVSCAVVASVLAGVFDSEGVPSRWFAVPKVWLGLRWLAGVIGPLVISWMVSQILKHRNTQAATGVLFVGVILAFIGDMLAELLWRETRIPW